MDALKFLVFIVASILWVRQVGMGKTTLILLMIWLSNQYSEASFLLAGFLLSLLWIETRRYNELARTIRKAPAQEYGDRHQTVIISNKVIDHLF